MPAWNSPDAEVQRPPYHSRCFTLPNGECVSPFECPHGPPHPPAVTALARLGETVRTPRGLFDKGSASSDRIPIAVAKALSEAHQLPQVIIVAWDGSREHVVTYGTTLGDADNAAQGGNLVRDALQWPPDRYATSGRVAEFVRHANALLDRLEQIAKEPQAGHSTWREVSALRDLLVAEGFRS